VRKLKRGIEKYKGKIPFKCFNYGKVGHFSFKCPYARHSNSDEEEYPMKEKKYKKRNKGIFLKKKSLYSKEDSFSFDEDDDSDNDSRRVILFMSLETQEETTENNEGDYEDEGEVNIEEELINALSDMRIERKKNKSLK
jgi:hypothetical protein